MLIENQQEIYQKIANEKEQRRPVFIWVHEAGHVFKVPVTLSQIMRDDKTIVFQVDLEDVGAVEEVLLLNKKFLRFYLPQNSLFFEVRTKYFKGTGKLGTDFPKHVSFIDRRKKPRFIPGDLFRIKIVRQGFTSHKNCFDFSIGGFSIVFNKSEQCSYREDEIIDNVEITYDKFKMNLSVKVVGVKLIKPFLYEHIPYGHKKVSFQFQNMDKNTSGIIKDIVEYHTGPVDED